MDKESTNSVRLAGHVSGTPVQRQLPSGDRLVSSRTRRAAVRLEDGEAVVVSGELRRSFRRSGSGVTSWVTVDVDQIDR